MSIQVYLSLFLLIIGIGELKIVNGYSGGETALTQETGIEVLDSSKVAHNDESLHVAQPGYTFYQNLYSQLYNVLTFILKPPQVETPYTSKQFGEIFNLINPGCSVSTPIGTLILPIRDASFTTTDEIFRISPRFGHVFSNMNYLVPYHLQYLPSPKQFNGILNLINPACSISTPIGTLVLPIRDSESSEVADPSPSVLDE